MFYFEIDSLSYCIVFPIFKNTKITKYRAVVGGGKGKFYFDF